MGILNRHRPTENRVWYYFDWIGLFRLFLRIIKFNSLKKNRLTAHFCKVTNCHNPASPLYLPCIYSSLPLTLHPPPSLTYCIPFHLPHCCALSSENILVHMYKQDAWVCSIEISIEVWPVLFPPQNKTSTNLKYICLHLHYANVTVLQCVIIYTSPRCVVNYKSHWCILNHLSHRLKQVRKITCTYNQYFEIYYKNKLVHYAYHKCAIFMA